MSMLMYAGNWNLGPHVNSKHFVNHTIVLVLQTPYVTEDNLEPWFLCFHLDAKFADVCTAGWVLFLCRQVLVSRLLFSFHVSRGVIGPGGKCFGPLNHLTTTASGVLFCFCVCLFVCFWDWVSLYNNTTTTTRLQIGNLKIFPELKCMSFLLPWAQTISLHLLCVILNFNNLDSGENLQEHKARAREMVHVNELYFRLVCFILSFPLITVMFLLSLLLNSLMVSCEASTERDSNMQHLNYFPRAHAPWMVLLAWSGLFIKFYIWKYWGIM